MEPAAIQTAYLNAILQKADLCNQRIHQTWFWFIGFAAIGYLLTHSQGTTLSLFGATASVPHNLIASTIPLVLAALFYASSCYAALEDMYYKEMRRALGNGDGTDRLLAQLEMKLMEAPSFYTYAEVRAIAGTAKGFVVASEAVTLLLVFIAGFAPVGVVAYFITKAVGTFGVSWVSGVQIFAVFLTAFGLFQFFERLKYPRPRP